MSFKLYRLVYFLVCFMVLQESAVLLLGGSAQAQVTSDGTLPSPTNVPLSPNGKDFFINGGSRSGNNLFHSFSQFSVPTNGSALFNNAMDVQNIFSRVTGSQISNIDGLLKTQGSANLFFMNPNGIVFGPNARLELGGSFLGTTATGIKFSDGIEFNTVNATPALLSVKVPIGLQMGTNPGAIQVQGNGYQVSQSQFLLPLNSELSVKPGNTLALIGGQVNLDGAVLLAPEGQISIGSTAAGSVGLTSTSQGWTLDYAGVSTFQDIRLARQSLLRVVGDGSIHLKGRHITLQDGSLGAITNTNTRSATGQINVQASESITLLGMNPDERLSSGLWTSASDRGNSSDIVVATGQLTLQNGAAIVALAPTFGRLSGGGEIRIQAADWIKIRGASPLKKVTSQLMAITSSANHSGNLRLSTGQFTLLDGGTVGSYSTGEGAAGNVVVDASEFVKIIGIEPVFLQPSIIGSSTLNSGNAGQVTINTQRLLVQAGGRIDSSTIGKGNAGSVLVNASESVEVSGRVSGSRNPSLIISSANILDEPLRLSLGAPLVPSGTAGSVTINTRKLLVTDGGSITVKNEGMGNAGNLSVNAETIALNNGQITAGTTQGEGGNLFLRGNILLLRDGSSITATAGGMGAGGNITIQAPIIVGLENSDIIANAFTGKGGMININTQSIWGLKYRDRLTSDNDITASSEFGISGNVQLNTIGINPANALNTLPLEIHDSSNQIADHCASTKNSHFAFTGRGGMAQNPMKERRTNRTWHDLRSNVTQSTVVMSPMIEQTRPSLVEATAIQVDESGEIALVNAKPAEIRSAATCGMGDR
jgi:filamentous hemagglutinin family protein